MIPADLVLLSEVAARLPGKTVEDLKRLERRREFPDIIEIGGTLYVREADVDAWLHGRLLSVRREVQLAQLRHAGLRPLVNRRSKAGA